MLNIDNFRDGINLELNVNIFNYSFINQLNKNELIKYINNKYSIDITEVIDKCIYVADLYNEVEKLMKDGHKEKSDLELEVNGLIHSLKWLESVECFINEITSDLKDGRYIIENNNNIITIKNGYINEYKPKYGDTVFIDGVMVIFSNNRWSKCLL